MSWGYCLGDIGDYFLLASVCQIQQYFLCEAPQRIVCEDVDEWVVSKLWMCHIKGRCNKINVRESRVLERCET